jgi:hypothetical protein
VEKMYLEPAEIAKKYSEVGRKKTHCPAYKLILLGILAGAFIALAAQGSNVAIHTIASVGLGKTSGRSNLCYGLNDGYNNRGGVIYRQYANRHILLGEKELLAKNAAKLVLCLLRKLHRLHPYCPFDTFFRTIQLFRRVARRFYH